jgi:hypothetical protein
VKNSCCIHQANSNKQDQEQKIRSEQEEEQHREKSEKYIYIYKQQILVHLIKRRCSGQAADASESNGASISSGRKEKEERKHNNISHTNNP